MLSAAVFIVMLIVIMLSVIMLSVIMLSVIKLSVIMLSVIILSVIMLSVMLSVAASTKLVCFILEKNSAQIYHFLLRLDGPLSYLRFLSYLISA